MELARDRTALLLIEFQKQWTGPGLYNRSIARELRRRDVIGNSLELVAASRAAGVPVVHAPLVIDPKQLNGTFARLTRGRVFTAGSSRAELTNGIHSPGDSVVHGRTAFDAFVDSDLEQVLRAAGAETIVICGFTTDQCVVKTFRTALARGFDAFVVPDCTATFSRIMQRRSERTFGPRALSLAEVRTALAG
ncbi:cysteine hydrolase [Aldersonia sp. NBC_00410]|uniref:cysteine hydrolase n=1 Tax=Aldersonia sp. NBC_00410 TaxID=2975954 RepID=UPI002254424A|nr:cysteine hydrolase [Aldersonia sp. NBC_00410]MCX5042810.1 cysteine hydrolase [Aldersonia sp. NBC_00410]